METIQQHLEDWLSGNEAAFKPVFRHFYHRMLSFSIRFLRDRQEAEEITMDVMLKIWQRKDSLGLQPSTFQSYLFVVLRNELVSLHRKKKHVIVPLEAVEDLQAPAGDNLYEMQEAVQYYNTCLSRLPAKRREVFLLSREQGLTHAEIALQLGLSVFTVKNHIKAALAQLRTELPMPLFYGTFLLDAMLS